MTITQQYHRKPEPVEAVLVTRENVYDVASWCGGQVKEEYKSSDHTDVSLSVNFPTLNGAENAPIGNYLVKGANGAFVRYTSPGFEREYEVVASEDYIPTN